MPLLAPSLHASSVHLAVNKLRKYENILWWKKLDRTSRPISHSKDLSLKLKAEASMESIDVVLNKKEKKVAGNTSTFFSREMESLGRKIINARDTFCREHDKFLSLSKDSKFN